MDIRVIVTIPPYADFIRDVAQHPLVDGFRLNTVMPVREELPDLLNRLRDFGKPVWVDLKGRQLRVMQAAIPPFTEVCLNHVISVDTPVDAFFSDGRERARILAVDKNRLILEDSPRRLVGPGESVNIPHPSLKIHGSLTDTDMRYLEAMKETSFQTVMLSYVESVEDIEEVKRILPDAEVLAKIESQMGLSFVRSGNFSPGSLIAARGDLFVEVKRPHMIARVLREIIEHDPQAIVASRLFDSLVDHPVPSSADIGDVAYLLSVGYRQFMLGDVLCLHEETITEALNLLEALAEDIL